MISWFPTLFIGKQRTLLKQAKTGFSLKVLPHWLKEECQFIFDLGGGGGGECKYRRFGEVLFTVMKL